MNKEITMALLDLQTMDVPETDGHGGESSVSLLLCDKHSSHSNLLCL
ncbi:SapB/AmfS family lanthipeptide [Streptomyces sp. NPDC002659]